MVPAEVAMAVHPKSKQRFLLPFGKQLYYVPESAVVSYPKRSNRVNNGSELGAALATKAPERWFPYCSPDTLVQLRGGEGTSVYTVPHCPIPTRHPATSASVLHLQCHGSDAMCSCARTRRSRYLVFQTKFGFCATSDQLSLQRCSSSGRRRQRSR